MLLLRLRGDDVVFSKTGLKFAIKAWIARVQSWTFGSLPRVRTVSLGCIIGLGRPRSLGAGVGIGRYLVCTFQAYLGTLPAQRALQQQDRQYGYFTLSARIKYK